MRMPLSSSSHRNKYPRPSTTRAPISSLGSQFKLLFGIENKDEVLAISEKVVIRVEDLVTWITSEAEWTWGRLAKCEKDLGPLEGNEEGGGVPPKKTAGMSFSLTDNGLDFSDVDSERKNWELQTKQEPTTAQPPPRVLILSYPKYCRYRATMKRLDGVEDSVLRRKIVHALGGFYVAHPRTRVLFCRDTFDYPELEGHDMLCNHLAPKLKGRPRGRRKKRSVSPGSESNESEASVKVGAGYNTRGDSKNGLRGESGITPRRSTRCHENNENREFVRKLGSFMKSNRTPIGRIPSLGYKELNLHEFFSKVQRLGGYDSVTGNRLWKSIFEEMSGHQNSTSAATIIRRHYERFLLPYERHVRGEEYKPIPGSARRRLKSKRGSSSLSDADSSSCDSNPMPSTSTKMPSTTVTPSENKDNSRVEGKPSSLRSVRVKPERQKEKRSQSDKETVHNNNNGENNINNNSDNFQPTVKTETKTEKLIIKTESMTVETELSTVITQSNPVKIEYTTAKSETISPTADLNPEKTSENVTISVTIETNLVKTESCPVSSVVKFENISNASVKIEPTEIKNEDIKREQEEIKREPEEIEPQSVKTEPARTITPTPVAPNSPASDVNLPVEGKENIPVLQTRDSETPSQHHLEMETTLKSRLPEVDPETDSCRIKKRKLDILKEGGLEVTPVKPSSLKDLRPSVIQVSTPPVQKREIMPPPVGITVHQKRSPINVPQSLNISHVKGSSPSTPTKKATSPSGSFPFLTGSTPPKVMQSRSIYSYSEKVVYGNPKDIFPKSSPHAPKFAHPSLPRQSGGDPVDLSVNSPQKPFVETMRAPPSTSISPYNRDSVTKNLYKTNTQLMEGRRLGPNLEITLVGPNKPYTSPTSSNYPQAQKRLSPEDNPISRYNKRVASAKPSVFAKPEPMAKMPPPKPHSSPALPSFPPYLTQLYEQVNKGLPPYLPFIDPTMYYTAAMQNMYSGGNVNSAPPMMPIASAEQLKLYAELMAHGRLPFPFSLQTDNNNTKKQ
ncbi:unnamed protein product [Phaedon cochleariae]|uniref:ARID domain-containing protein n=1 Tax=Phaedon cochleariae TaxID=80249 RepID=A0A9P0DRY4_PHACE|nr:unnamed protein product [Phaedon cochleariae]